MAAQILSGKEVAADMRQRLQVEVASYGQTFKPGLTIVQVRNKVLRLKPFNFQPFIVHTGGWTSRLKCLHQHENQSG